MRLALLKSPLPGIRHTLAHRLGAAVDHSPYSHSNLVFTNGSSGSAWADVGVDIEDVEYEAELWDFFTLPPEIELESRAHAWFSHNRSKPYDHAGALRFGISILQEAPGKFFCHEAIAAALGWSDPWRYGPGLLLARCRDQFNSQKVDSPWSPASSLHPVFMEAATL